MKSFEENPSLFLEEHIQRFVAESEDNRFHTIDESAIFEEPLLGFANGDDPLFQEYKKVIGEFHLTPREALRLAGGKYFGAPAEEPEDVSVICWVLPVAQRTRRSNRPREQFPSLRWSHTREYGESFNNRLRQEVVGLLAQKGYLAVAPATASFFRWFTLPEGPISVWSERHACYAAGLGTFSLSDGLITPKGIAHRCGSVVTNLKLPPSQRKYQSPYENCSYYRNGSCKDCIDRCPVGAITAKGHDKNKCRHHLVEELGPLKQRYAVANLGCGLCQTNVPCEAGIP